MISGSVLTGRHAEGPFAYLGRYARQVTLIKEDREQLAFGWIKPQPNKFSVMPVLASAFGAAKKIQPDVEFKRWSPCDGTNRYF
jgi:Na+-transporting NADH:ubiquinone oxidoreductase subunit A